MVVLLPFDWHPLLWLMTLLLLVVLVCMVKERHIGNHSLSSPARWTLWLIVTYFLYQAISLTYSTNIDQGINLLLRRFPLLLMPLLFLAADTSYLSRARLRNLMYAFTVSLIFKFFICLIIMFVCHRSNAFGSQFDPIHHAYIAMYLLLAMGFLYHEWLLLPTTTPRWQRTSLIIAELLLAIYVVMVASRSGIVIMALMFIAIVLHQIFTLKNIRQGLLTLIAGVAVATLTFALLPSGTHRLAQTVIEASEGDKSDIRYTIYSSSLTAISRNLPFGVGIGDCNETMMDIFDEVGGDDGDYCLQSQFNSHNIYLDSALATGIPGLALLLALLIVPAVEALRRRDIIMLSFLLVFAISGMFEAILNRSIGIYFFALFAPLLLGAAKQDYSDARFNAL